MNTDKMEKLNKYRGYMIGAGLLLLGIFVGTLFSGGEGSSGVSHSEEEHLQSEETWTCSMHPQIRSSGPGKCPICGMDLIPLEDSGGALLSPDEIVLSEEAIQLANIQTSVVGRSAAQREIRLLGTVKPDEGRLYSQVSHLPGRIERLYLSFTGEYIRRGQRIVRLYSPELISAQRELLEAIKSRDVYPQLYEASRNKLKLWKISDGQIDKIIASGEVQEQIDILSEHSGYVMKRNVEIGDYVTPGMNLYEIANLERVWIMFEAYESDIPWIEGGDEVEFSVQAIPGTSFKGKVTYIDPFVSPGSRVAKVRVEVGNKDGKLLPEMFASGVIRSEMNLNTDALVIPKSAVLWTGKRGVVYVKAQGTQSHAFRYREIELGADLGDFYVVSSGLEEGEEIATNGVFRIDASAQLSGKRSMMNPEGAGAKTGHVHGGLKNSATGEKGSAENGVTEDFSDSVDPEFKEQFGTVIQHYMDIKNSLINDQVRETREAAVLMRTGLDRVDTKLVKGEAHSVWMEEMQKLITSLEKIRSSENIEDQRTEFSILSNVLSGAVQKFGWSTKKEGVIYLEYCPMANKDRGGYWLSFENQIRNPYFGEQMLECGEVVRTITK